jgi:CBS domain-containing protein
MEGLAMTPADVSMEAAGEETANTIQDERGMQTPIAENPPLSPFTMTAEQPGAAAAQDPTQDPQTPSNPSSTAAFAQAIPKLSNPYAPLATATLDTTVFDVVHMFSELGISSVPILDTEGGNVVDLYEAVDVVQLVRTGAYQALDLTIRQALARRPSDFPGVITCSPDDSLANIFALLRRRRVHRLLILEQEVRHDQSAEGETSAGEGGKKGPPTPPPVPTTPRELEDQLESGFMRKRRQGKLVGILCLSDILRYVIGESETGAASTPSTGAPATASSGPQTSGTSIAASPSGSWLHYQIPTSASAAGSARSGSGQNTAAEGNSPFPSLPASASGSTAHMSTVRAQSEEVAGEGAEAAAGMQSAGSGPDLTDDTPTMEEPEPDLRPYEPPAGDAADAGESAAAAR